VKRLKKIKLKNKCPKNRLCFQPDLQNEKHVLNY